MDSAGEEQLDEVRLDRTQFSVVRLTDPDDSLEYRLSRPVEERLQALEFVRRTFYGSASTGEGLQRVLEVVNLEQR
jgi:hypothetical protein